MQAVMFIAQDINPDEDGFFGLGFLLLALYLLPTIVAYVRRVPNKGSVAIINVFLGWTIAGWVIALAMAARSRQTPGPDLDRHPMRECPYCRSNIRADATVCPYCQRESEPREATEIQRRPIWPPPPPGRGKPSPRG